MVYNGIPDLFYGLNECNNIDILSDRPKLHRKRLQKAMEEDTEASLCSPTNRINLLNVGVSHVSLEKGVRACGVSEIPGDLLHTMTQQKVNLKRPSSKAKRQCISESPRFWIILINSHKVNFDTEIFDFFDINLALGVVEKENFWEKIAHGKCILIVRWVDDRSAFEIVSCVLFILGTDCIYCPYMATSVQNHTKKSCGPNADNLPYRRRRLIRVLLSNLQMMSINVFGWNQPRLVIQADPRKTQAVECFKRLGFVLLDFQYITDDKVPQLTDDVPFEIYPVKWRLFVHHSSRSLFGDYNSNERYFRFYMTSTVTAGGTNQGHISIRKKIAPLELFLSETKDLNMKWMQNMELVLGSNKTCSAKNKCMYYRKRLTPPMHQYAFCMYCKSDCHPECCYARVEEEDLCVPIDMFHSYRHPDVYGTCLHCYTEKMNDGSLCRHNSAIIRSSSGIGTITCQYQSQKIHSQHCCVRCKEPIHPMCCTYVPIDVHNDMAQVNGEGLCAVPHNLENTPERLYVSEPICDYCRLSTTFDIDAHECCENHSAISMCRNSHEQIDFYLRCFECKRSIHYDCCKSRVSNPNCAWNWMMAGEGCHWPGAELVYCGDCDVTRKFTIIPCMSDIPKCMNDPDLLPDDMNVGKMVTACYTEQENIFENNIGLNHAIEFGKEVIPYSLDHKVYWELSIIRLFFYLLAKHLPRDVGLLHDGFNIGNIERGNFAMTRGWQNKHTIMQWVFQGGGRYGKDSKNGHWSLIVYERLGNGSNSNQLGRTGLVRIYDSLAEPNKAFYNKMIMKVIKALGFYEGTKPGKTLYIPKYKRTIRKGGVHPVSKNDMDPMTRIDSRRWVIFEDPNAIMLLDGPDCGPITCIEALKKVPIGLEAEVNMSVVIPEVELIHLRSLVFHYIGNMLSNGINRQNFVYSSLTLQNDTMGEEVMDSLSTRMNIISRDFECGWGNQSYKELCIDDSCPICLGKIWKIGSSHAKFTCYLSCACMKRMHFSCFVSTLVSWDQMERIRTPEQHAIYTEDDWLGHLFKCPACNNLNEPGLVYVHNCDGSLITAVQLPSYPHAEDNVQEDRLRIDNDDRINFVLFRREWVRNNCFPIMWEEAKLLTYFNEEESKYLSLRTEGNDITSDKILLCSDVVEDSVTPEVLAAEDHAATYYDVPVTEAVSTSNDNDSNTGVNVTQEIHTSANNPNIVSDDGLPIISIKDISTCAEIQKDAAVDDAHSTDGTIDDSTAVDNVSDARALTNSTTNADDMSTAVIVEEAPAIEKNKSITIGVVQKKRRRQSKRHRLKLADVYIVSKADRAYIVTKPDEVDGNGTESLEKDYIVKNLTYHWTKEETDEIVSKVILSKTTHYRMSKLQESLVEEKGKPNSNGHSARLACLLHKEKLIVGEFESEQIEKRFDQVTRLMFVDSSVKSKTKKKKSNSVDSVEPPEWFHWKGKLLTGPIIDLQSNWVNRHFPKGVLKLIKEKAGSFVEVPPGACNVIKESNQENLLGNRWLPPVERHLVWARQAGNDWQCLSYATASVLYYLGDTFGAAFMKERRIELDFDSFILAMKKHLGYVRIPSVKNKVSLKTCRAYQMNAFCIGQVVGRDGGTEHVIGITDNWIFDSTCEAALPLCNVSLNRCCSDVDFVCFQRLFIFEKTFRVTKTRSKNTINKSK